MFSEEIEMTMECAVKVRKHLATILENKSDELLEAKLRYVDGLILQANTLQSEVLAV
ncbi:MAG: hypothetical protein AAFY41_17195 [Bacteroidota bacterium]